MHHKGIPGRADRSTAGGHHLPRPPRDWNRGPRVRRRCHRLGSTSPHLRDRSSAMCPVRAGRASAGPSRRRGGSVLGRSKAFTWPMPRIRRSLSLARARGTGDYPEYRSEALSLFPDRDNRGRRPTSGERLRAPPRSRPVRRQPEPAIAQTNRRRWLKHEQAPSEPVGMSWGFEAGRVHDQVPSGRASILGVACSGTPAILAGRLVHVDVGEDVEHFTD